MNMKGKHFESTQNIKAVPTLQLNILMKRTFKNASEGGKNDRVSVLKESGVFRRGLMIECVLKKI